MNKFSIVVVAMLLATPLLTPAQAGYEPTPECTAALVSLNKAFLTEPAEVSTVPQPIIDAVVAAYASCDEVGSPPTVAADAVAGASCPSGFHQSRYAPITLTITAGVARSFGQAGNTDVDTYSTNPKIRVETQMKSLYGYKANSQGSNGIVYIGGFAIGATSSSASATCASYGVIGHSGFAAYVPSASPFACRANLEAVE